jgi:hypothetical protein
MSIEKVSDIGDRTRDLPACSIVPQPTTLPRAPAPNHTLYKYQIERIRYIILANGHVI